MHCICHWVVPHSLPTAPAGNYEYYQHNTRRDDNPDKEFFQLKIRLVNHCPDIRVDLDGIVDDFVLVLMVALRESLCFDNNTDGGKEVSFVEQCSKICQRNDKLNLRSFCDISVLLLGELVFCLDEFTVDNLRELPGVVRNEDCVVVHLCRVVQPIVHYLIGVDDDVVFQKIVSEIE